MTKEHTDLSRLNRLVTREKIAAQGFIKPCRVTVLRGTDHTGEDALDVSIVLPDAVTDEQLSWRKIKPLKEWVWQTLWKATDESLYPYITFWRESEALHALS